MRRNGVYIDTYIVRINQIVKETKNYRVINGEKIEGDVALKAIFLM